MVELYILPHAADSANQAVSHKSINSLLANQLGQLIAHGGASTPNIENQYAQVMRDDSGNVPEKPKLASIESVLKQDPSYQDYLSDLQRLREGRKMGVNFRLLAPDPLENPSKQDTKKLLAELQKRNNALIELFIIQLKSIVGPNGPTKGQKNYAWHLKNTLDDFLQFQEKIQDDYPTLLESDLKNSEVHDIYSELKAIDRAISSNLYDFEQSKEGVQAGSLQVAPGADKAVYIALKNTAQARLTQIAGIYYTNVDNAKPSLVAERIRKIEKAMQTAIEKSPINFNAMLKQLNIRVTVDERALGFALANNRMITGDNGIPIGTIRYQGNSDYAFSIDDPEKTSPEKLAAASANELFDLWGQYKSLDPEAAMIYKNLVATPEYQMVGVLFNMHYTEESITREDFAKKYAETLPIYINNYGVARTKNFTPQQTKELDKLTALITRGEYVTFSALWNAASPYFHEGF